MTISLVQVRLLGFLGGAIMMVAATPDSYATRSPIIPCSSLTDSHHKKHWTAWPTPNK